MWRRNWPLAPVLLVVGGVLAVVYRTTRDLPLLVGECVIGSALIIVCFGAFKRFSYASATDAGLQLHWTFPFMSTTVPYEVIRSTRVEELRKFYPVNRKTYINAMTKPLLDKPAFFARLAAEEEAAAAVIKRLGRRYVVDGVLAIPVADPRTLSQEVTQRLPTRSQPNLGGAKRTKRKR